MEGILIGYLNTKLQDTKDVREGDIVTELADIGLVNMKSHFMPRRRYRGEGRWMWQMRKEVRQVMERGDSMFSMDRHRLSNTRVREARLLTYQWMVLAVL